MKVQKGIPDGQTAQLDNRDVWLAKFHFRALSPPEHSEKLSDCHLAIGRPPDKPAIGFINGDMATDVARQARQIGIEFASGLVDACALSCFSGQQGIFSSSAAIKRTCTFLDNRNLLEQSPIHCSSNAGVSGQTIDKQRRFILSRSRGTRGPHVFLRLSTALATTC